MYPDSGDDSAVSDSAIPARDSHTEAARQERLEWLRTRQGTPLAPLQPMRLHADDLSNNVENLIGAVEVPVGLAGPLVFDGTHASGSLYAPLATTEGALVASASRGARALSQAGGVRTHAVSQRMTRAPVFQLGSLGQAAVFTDWVGDHLEELRGQAARVSRHATLVSVRAVMTGRTVHVVFAYETGDAAGQNMTSACTWHACQWILDRFPAETSADVECFRVEGNLSGDKKVTYHSFLNGRGTRVVAEAELSDHVLRRVLNTGRASLLDTHRIQRGGGLHGGMVGNDVCIANVIGGMFTALGQDIASVHESSLGHLELEPVDEGVRATMVLPALIVGTVGGGTRLPAQHALLEMLGCAGPGGQSRLAEIIAGFALALDLSTMSAVSADEFVAAHERLGRNRPPAVPAVPADT
ncbi:hydroxymethylglutaryl-CoA reductase [Streptomyces daliensis]|uniref:hydroxymethylglutaryl-CoA reductase (NADPH) n=1 Tax=Streptomyces daliensis TaxID=299421 RepID=A0A8T4IPL5_9ACTN|nr:hydroxymethylglutaryl-CoA reductase [Streptomyces daliensis]